MTCAQTQEGRSRWLRLSALSLGAAMIIVDATIVNVAVASLVKGLGLDSTQAEWVNTTYALAFAALVMSFLIPVPEPARAAIAADGAATPGSI